MLQKRIVLVQLSLHWYSIKNCQSLLDFIRPISPLIMYHFIPEKKCTFLNVHIIQDTKVLYNLGQCYNDYMVDIVNFQSHSVISDGMFVLDIKFYIGLVYCVVYCCILYVKLSYLSILGQYYLIMSFKIDTIGSQNVHSHGILKMCDYIFCIIY